MSEKFYEKCEIKENHELGRYIVARKDIKPGEVLIYETPILILPHFDVGLICTNCFRASEIICKKCNIFPLCLNCNNHNQFDCEFFSKQNLIKQNFLIENFSIFGLLKCLLFMENSDNDEIVIEFLKMESHLDKRKDSEIWKSLDEMIIQPLRNSGIEQLLRKTKIIENDLLQKICAIFDVNSFEIRGPEISMSLRGLYLKASLLAHNCMANTAIAVDENYLMKIYATVPIKQGDIINYNYTNPLMGTQQRQANLKLGKYFDCHCERCTDPTELNTNMSAIKCQNCPSGYYLEIVKKWTCNNCKMEMEQSVVNQLLFRANEEVSLALNNIKELENLIINFVKIFHQNHWILIDLKQNVASILRTICNDPMYQPGIQVYERKLQLCNEILVILRIIQPGISRLTGIALYEYFCPFIEITKRNYRKMSKENYLAELQKGEKILKESVSMLLYEPVNTPEGLLAKEILMELKDLRNSIKEIGEMNLNLL